MKQYVIWKGIASVEIPDSFQAATIGEKRKIFGNLDKKHLYKMVIYGII